jgi:hypothetical protein
MQTKMAKKKKNTHAHENMRNSFLCFFLGGEGMVGLENE